MFAAVAASGVWLLALPPRTRQIPDAPGLAETVARTARGAIHVHSNRSDGTGTPEQIAAAAAAAGLRFVLLTDHGDATRLPDPPTYHAGVLLLDGVEISTTEGHLVAFGLSRSPYPLAGDARDVLDDVHRLGGLGFAAHPHSEKPGLRWTDWKAPLDGLEWINADSEWRDESWPRLLLGLTHYPFRPAETVAALFDEPGATLQQWDRLAAEARVFGVAGADAHARLGIDRTSEQRSGLIIARVPSYEATFRAFSVHVQTVSPLTGDDAASDGASVIEALRQGRAYSALDGLASPVSMAFDAERDGEDPLMMGDEAPAGSPTRWRVQVAAPDSARVLLRHNGETLAEGAPPRLVYDGTGESGTYRVEVHLGTAPGRPPVPFIVSNPIFLRGQAGPPTDHGRRVVESRSLYVDGPVDSWQVEHQADSLGAVDAVPVERKGHEVALRYALHTNPVVGPYAAGVLPLSGGLAGFDRLTFQARADRDLRISVQLRSPGDGLPRWRRSVHLDLTAREVIIPFDQMRAVPPETRQGPPLDAVDALLFVVDTVNTAPGAAGIVWLDEVRVERTEPIR